MYKKIALLILFPVLILSQENSWSLKVFLNTHKEQVESIMPLADLEKSIDQWPEKITDSLVLKKYQIPIAYETIFEHQESPQSPYKQNDTDLIYGKKTIHIKTVTHKKYLRGVIGKIVLTLLEELNKRNNLNTIDDYFVKQYEAVISLFTWLNEHIKDGILYDNSLEIHGWIHQMIYAIEKYNLEIMYEWLCEEIIVTGLNTGFTHPLIDQLKDIVTYDKENFSKNNFSTVIFKDADSFYSWSIFVGIFGIPSDFDFMKHNYIYLVDNNPQKTREFFKNLIEKKFKCNSANDDKDHEDDNSQNSLKGKMNSLLLLIDNNYKYDYYPVQHIYKKE